VAGKATDHPSNWKSTLIPTLPGYEYTAQRASLALDSKGNPAVAFILNGDNGSAEAFWRRGGNTVLVADNGGYGTDDPDVRLFFFGTQPRVVYAGAMDDNYFADYDHALWLIASPDDGTTWGRRVNVPSDGNRDPTPPVDIAVGSKGQVAIVTGDNGGNPGGVACGDPKLAISADLLNWKTRGPSTLRSPEIFAYSPSVAFSGNDRLYVAFLEATTAENALTHGVTVWRQPPAWNSPPPPPQE
jgi:hypothetical protein